MKQKINRFFSTSFFYLVLSVFLFFIANPNPIIKEGLGFFAWIYYVPLLLCVRKLKASNSWFAGFSFGCLFYLSYAYWLYNYGLECLIFICIYYGVIYSVLFELLVYTKKTKCNYVWILDFLIISTFEYIKTLGFLGNSYGMSAYTQWKYQFIIQICDLIGANGFNYIIIFSSCLIYGFIDKGLTKKEYIFDLETNTQINQYQSHLHFLNEHEKKLKSMSFMPNIIISILFCVFLFFTVIYGTSTKNKHHLTETVKISLIQHNGNPDKNGIDADVENFHVLKELTDTVLEMDDNIDIFLWPETSIVTTIPYNYYLGTINEANSNLNSVVFVNNILEYLNKKEQMFVIGNNYLDFDRYTGEKLNRYNSAMILTGGMNTLPPMPGIYKKNKLVAFTEGFKYKNKFPGIANFLEDKYGHLYTEGEDIRIFGYYKKGFIFGTPICFEDTFSDICRKMYLHGARCFLNLSDDSWGKSNSCQYQHLSMSVFRSIENRVPSVRSTCSGVTCYINPRGEVAAKIPENIKSFLNVEIPVISLMREPTFYCNYGYYFEYVIPIITLLLLLIQIIVVIIKLIQIKGAKNGKK